MHKTLAGVDLLEIRPAVIDLVQRLRHAGIAISDRRAVKLQRLIAASSLLAGRAKARLSDIWVFRYIWDAVEQQEILASVVQQAIEKSPAAPDDHPRARGDETPDAEGLARDLEQLSQRLGNGQTAAADRAGIPDQLGLLAARCQWVKDELQRSVLLGRIEELWKRIGNKS